MPYSYPFSATDDYTKKAVWNKGQIIEGFDAAIWRWDMCGKVMKYSEHGNTNSEHGWEIDHIMPRALGGLTALENLQPLNWKVNRAKGDTFPWNCSML